MPKLPKYLARLQKNARNKEYRLRQRGANALGVGEASPRLPASVVANMSVSEQRAYAARLRRFNSRDNSLHVYAETGAVVPKSTFRAIEEGQRRYNEAMRQRVEGLAQLVKGTTLEERTRAQIDDLRYRLATSTRQLGGVYIGGRVARISIEPPTTAEVARRREKMVREMNTRESDSDRRTRVRKNAMQMLYLMGADAQARKISNLSNQQFDVLVSVTNFFDLISVPFDSDDYTAAELSLSNQQWASYYKTMAEGDALNEMGTERVATVDDLINEVRRQVSRR